MKIATQVRDSIYGKSAVGVRARLRRAVGNDWTMVAEAETNSGGCIDCWNKLQLRHGLYQIVFDTDSYFAGIGLTAAYPEIVVTFRMRDQSYAFEVQVTLAPHSYTAYCGAVDGRPMDDG